MTAPSFAPAPDPAAPASLLQMMTGYWVSQALYVTARLRVADLLADGPRSVDALASAAGAHPAALYRVLRALASVGVFTEAAPRTFVLTTLADLLHSDVPGSMRARPPLCRGAVPRLGRLAPQCPDRTPAFDQRFGMPYLDYLAEHPDADAVFKRR